MLQTQFGRSRVSRRCLSFLSLRSAHSVKNEREVVNELERRLGFTLPSDYGQFLVSHADSFLESPVTFRSPRAGLVDLLLTASEILKNTDNNQIGIPERSLLHIGGSLMGGYLYLRVSADGFGEIHYSERMRFKEVFPSFSAFLNETETNHA